MNKIKEYKPLIIIYFRDIDWSIGALQTDAKNYKSIVTSWQSGKLIEVEWIPINVNLIQKIDKPQNDLEELFYTQSRQFRQWADAKAVKRGFKNYLSELQSLPTQENQIFKLDQSIKSFISETTTHEAN